MNELSKGLAILRDEAAGKFGHKFKAEAEALLQEREHMRELLRQAYSQTEARGWRESVRTLLEVPSFTPNGSGDA
jgi:hypothetical protein